MMVPGLRDPVMTMPDSEGILKESVYYMRYDRYTRRCNAQ